MIRKWVLHERIFVSCVLHVSVYQCEFTKCNQPSELNRSTERIVVSKVHWIFSPTVAGISMYLLRMKRRKLRNSFRVFGVCSVEEWSLTHLASSWWLSDDRVLKTKNKNTATNIAAVKLHTHSQVGEFRKLWQNSCIQMIIKRTKQHIWESILSLFV